MKQFDNLSKERIKKGLETLYKNSNRGYNLLVDLLSWARSQSGNMELKRVTIDLSQIAEENIDILHDRAKEKGVALHSILQSKLSVFADKYMVSTVIRNLLTNAVKFTASGGEVKISSEEDGEFLKVIVSDSGIGISKENISKLFRLDTFYRTLGTDNEKGTGLGLVLCKEFIEKLNGKIWVESEPGKGSRFIFKLPST